MDAQKYFQEQTDRERSDRRNTLAQQLVEVMVDAGKTEQQILATLALITEGASKVMPTNTEAGDLLEASMHALIDKHRKQGPGAQ